MGFFNEIGKGLNQTLGAQQSAKQQWKYQKEAMQNAHQWEVADLKAAGLNPALSAGGSGASGSSPGTGGYAGSTGLTDMAQTAISFKNLMKDLEVKDAQIQELGTQSQKNLSEAGKTVSETGGTVPALTKKLEKAGEAMGNWVAEKHQKMIENSAKTEAEFQKTRKKILEEEGVDIDLASQLFK